MFYQNYQDFFKKINYYIISLDNDFLNTDVSFVIGTNDVTNPAAKTYKTSPIYRIPILDFKKTKSELFVK